MSDQKDQAPNSPSQSTVLPTKKRVFAEITPNYNSLDDFQFLRMTKKQKLDFLRKQAYFNVLHAFYKECPAISSQRILLVKDLRKEWNIDIKTHIAYQNAIKTDPMIQHFRNVSMASNDKAIQKAIAAAKRKPKKKDKLKIRDQVLAPAKIQDGKVLAPAKVQEEEAKLGSTSDDSPVQGWGKVSPWSLVGRWIDIRMRGKNDYVACFIKLYDAKTEMHHLVPILSKTDFEDPCNWTDLRHIPAKDIVWKEEYPGLPVRKCFLEPGQTLLLKTSTARKKKQLKEVGKTSTGIPIIRRDDKGKSIVGAKSPM